MRTGFYLLSYRQKTETTPPMYLQASDREDTTVFTGLEDTGSAFRLEKCGKKEFQISFIDEDEDLKPHFLSLHKHSTSTEPDRVVIGAKYPATFQLEHPIGGEIAIDLNTWKNEACYVRITSPRTGYLGYDEAPESAVFVADKAREKVGKVWMKYKLHKLERAELTDPLSAELELIRRYTELKYLST